MKRIWAPWRIEYITSGTKPAGCIFCDFPADADDDTNLILYRGKWSFVIMNRYPYNSSHIMIVPYRHTSRLDELTDKENIEMTRLFARSIGIFEEVLHIGGANLGMNIGRVAGAGIDEHIHYHIVPRWNGDTNFMPVLADIKVMPEYLRSTYDTLKPHFARLRLT